MPDSLLSQLRHLIQQAPRVPGVPRELRPTAPVFRQESGGFHPLQVCPEHLPASRPRAAASSSSRAQPEPHSGYLRAWSSRQNRCGGRGDGLLQVRDGGPQTVAAVSPSGRPGSCEGQSRWAAPESDHHRPSSLPLPAPPPTWPRSGADTPGDTSVVRLQLA
ncbi:beta-catenin-interacting protein 1 isoform X5 [Cavia porcellus]|uniref:beta-catenin-interacting protein 1 isoform X5 n=1 Tax=Cavia porcellus TaxID=10141 RepID=UPI002FE1AD64